MRRWVVALVPILVLAGWASAARAPRPPYQACRASAHLVAGESVPAWRMGVVDFLGPKRGVGVTLGQVPCARPQRGGGVEIIPTAAPLWLARSADGGWTWSLVGRPVPQRQPRYAIYGPALAVTGSQTAFVLSSDGTVWGTSDEGVSWRRQPVPRDVVALAARDGVAWALACPRGGRIFCHPALSREAAGKWVAATLPRTPAVGVPALTVVSPRTLIVTLMGDARREPLLVSRDGGRSFALVRAPSWAGRPCRPADVAAAGDRRWWILCLGQGAAGSSTKGLLRTDDAGAHWWLVSQVSSLTVAARPGELTSAEPAALVAGSATTLWLAGYNGLTVSRDGGARWSDVAGINQEGLPSAFDVRSPRRAWLLAPGGGLWQTDNGRRWRALGPLNTG